MKCVIRAHRVEVLHAGASETGRHLGRSDHTGHWMTIAHWFTEGHYVWHHICWRNNKSTRLPLNSHTKVITKLKELQFFLYN